MKKRSCDNDKCARVVLLDGTHICLIPPLTPPPSSSSNSERRWLPGSESSSNSRNNNSSTSIAAIELQSIVEHIYTSQFALSSPSSSSSKWSEHQQQHAKVEKGENTAGTDDIRSTEISNGREDFKADDDIRKIIGVVKFRLKNNDNHHDDHHIVFARRAPVSPVGSDMAYVDDDGVMYVRPSIEDKDATGDGTGNGSANTHRLVYHYHDHDQDDGDDETRVAARVNNQDGGYLVGDYCGINAWEQILFLPAITTVRNTATAQTQPQDMEQQRRMLWDILCRSVMVTGSHVLFRDGPHNDNVFRTDLQNGLTHIVIPPMMDVDTLGSSADDTTYGKKKRAITTLEGTTSKTTNSVTGGAVHTRKRPKLEVKSSASSPSPPSDIHPIQTRSPQSQSPNVANDANVATTETGHTAATDTSWQAMLTRGLEKKMRHESYKQRIKVHTERIQNLVIQRSRNVLQSLAINGMSNESNISAVSEKNEGYDDGVIGGGSVIPEMAQMRCGTRPINQGGLDDTSLSVEVHIEIDVILRDPSAPTVINDEGAIQPPSLEWNTEGGFALRSLRDLHLSCSPTESAISSDVQVRTCSAIVPNLQIGQCVTIMARVDVSGISSRLTPRPPLHCQGAEEGEDAGGFIGLSIAALWRKSDSDGSEKRDGGSPYRGIIIGSLRLPMETLFIDQSALHIDSDVQEDYMTHFVDFSSSLPSSHTASKTVVQNDSIFDYRRPRLLTIDISQSNTSHQTTNRPKDIQRDWERRMEGLIASVHRSRTGRIDVYAGEEEEEEAMGGDDKNRQRRYIRIAIFGSSPERRAGLVELVLKHLPETARIVQPPPPSSSDDLTDDFIHNRTTKSNYMARELVTALQNEICIMERHSSLLNGADDAQKKRKKSRKKKADTAEKFTTACLGKIVQSQYISDELAVRTLER